VHAKPHGAPAGVVYGSVNELNHWQAIQLKQALYERKKKRVGLDSDVARRDATADMASHITNACSEFHNGEIAAKMCRH